MKIRILYQFTVVCLLIPGCIESYVPYINEETNEILVILGEVTDLPGFQEVTVSTASSVGDPKFNPLPNCILSIENDKGKTFRLEEFKPGKYRVWMDQSELAPGISYRLNVTTPGGERIQSDFDQMPNTSAIDSIYYSRKKEYKSNLGVFVNGLQFYIDFHSNDPQNRYFRWVANESWEYHAPYPIVYYYNGIENKVWPPDYSLQVCWFTTQADHIFTLTTANLPSNSYLKFPLHYVDNTTNRLLIKYSVMMSQYSVSRAAYVFWEQLRINSDKQGRLYETQPLPVEGNLQNVTFPGKPVIGFFGASSVTQKRIFIDGIKDMDIQDGSFCSPEERGVGGWKNFEPWEYPIYFIYDFFLIKTLQSSCVDCRVMGGTLVKPEFWPN